MIRTGQMCLTLVPDWSNFALLAVWILLLLVIWSYVALIVIVAYVSARPPRVPEFVSPGFLHLPQEDVTFASADGCRLSAWWVPAEGSHSIAVLAHGYVVNRSELIPLAVRLHERGVSCLALDFRGHGFSEKRPVTFGWRERLDLVAAVRWARERQPDSRVVLIGSSMGAAAAALACAEDRSLADALVLDAPYSSLKAASSGWWRFLSGNLLAVLLAPATGLSRLWTGVNPGRVDVTKALSQCMGLPTLFLYGDEDKVVPKPEAERNVQAAGAEVVWFKGCNHAQGRYREPEAFESAILGFLERHGFLSR